MFGDRLVPIRFLVLTNMQRVQGDQRYRPRCGCHTEHGSSIVAYPGKKGDNHARRIYLRWSAYLIGRYAGKLSSVRPDDLLGGVLRAVVDKNPFKAEDMEDMVIGCANQGGEDSRCIALHAGLIAGLPIELGGSVVQRNCASGLNAIVNAAHAITAGEGELFLVGGVESMSRAPWVMAKGEAPFSREMRIFDSTIGSRFPNPKIIKQYGDDAMPQTADNLAKEFAISRAQADKFAYGSQQKYATAKGEGFFAGEINPVTIDKGRKAPPEVISDDEHPRPQTDMDALNKLRALYEGGVTTAGNASGVNDGAAALLVGSLKAGEKAGKKPIARILATGAAGFRRASWLVRSRRRRLWLVPA
jgi:acetyl-CoA C-acetyltransferase